jgi:hypothetical protein
MCYALKGLLQTFVLEKWFKQQKHQQNERDLWKIQIQRKIIVLKGKISLYIKLKRNID